jgi:uncharacterized RDD family membrane protein YckC
MRCPKCQYISFGSVDRCRNCGYEFSLAADAQPLDLPIHDGEQPLGPLSDLPLSERQIAAPVAPSGPPRSEPVPRPSTASRLDLPLFAEKAVNADSPLVVPRSVPEPPLSVRRPAPSIARTRLYSIAREGASAEDRLDPSNGMAAFGSEADHVARPAVELVTAGGGVRLLAGVVDMVILGLIDAGVVYSTLRALGLPVSEIRALPPVPLAAFLLLLNGSYFVTFTAAGGQTIGKMMTGIKVVTASSTTAEGAGGRVSFDAAFRRAAAYLASLLPAGLGLLPILFDPLGRGLHDRFADTRVVTSPH